MVSNLRLERRLELKLDDSVLYGFNSATLTDEGKKSIDVFLSDELVSKVFAVEHPDLSI